MRVTQKDTRMSSFIKFSSMSFLCRDKTERPKGSKVVVLRCVVEKGVLWLRTIEGILLMFKQKRDQKFYQPIEKNGHQRKLLILQLVHCP